MTARVLIRVVALVVLAMLLASTSSAHARSVDSRTRIGTAIFLTR